MDSRQIKDILVMLAYFAFVALALTAFVGFAVLAFLH